jgi:hypothetical protein
MSIDKDDLAIIMGAIKHLNDELQKVKSFNLNIIKLLVDKPEITREEILKELEKDMALYIIDGERNLTKKIREETLAKNDNRQV